MAALTYKYLSERDYRDAKILLNAGSYTASCSFFQQSVEKQLKYYIQINSSSDDMGVLTSLITAELYDRAVELGGVDANRNDRKMMSVLKDYYYDVNYPGENCREIERIEAEEAKTFVDEFLPKIKLS